MRPLYIVEPNFGFIMGIFFLLNKEFQKVRRDIWKIYGFTAHLAIIHIFQNKVILGSKLQYNNLGKVMQGLPIFLHSTILFCFFVFSTACHPPLFLVENANAKSADLWAFACRFSTLLKISTKKLPDFPAFSTGANALSTGVSRVFHHQWSFLTGKQQRA